MLLIIKGYEKDCKRDATELIRCEIELLKPCSCVRVCERVSDKRPKNYAQNIIEAHYFADSISQLWFFLSVGLLL